ncbi:MAG: branched-chain amino acid transport system II carrier protein [Bacteroidia bacterium]|nr:branched-chain amino acid transport system II carrier protein [Bacteroidia bacterium]
MKFSRDTLITALALFSLFFGAGNLILPPLLGFQSGPLWWIVTLGFCLSAVLIPIWGILAHARLQGTMYDFAKKVSPTFSLIYCTLIYIISVSLPSPRTASVTHEMAIAPFSDSPSWVTASVYFILVFIFVMNRSRIVSIIGKWLTPAILLILLAIIGITLFNPGLEMALPDLPNPFSVGLLEGYQTFDAIGAVVVGGVIIISINLNNPNASYKAKRKQIAQAGWLAGIALFLVYAGLILTGALWQEGFEPDISRTRLLTSIGSATLGATTNIFLSLLIALACFTTGVGIVTGAADFAKNRFNNSQKAYTITALVGCILGILMGQFNVGYIIMVALPVLLLIYPATIALILLNNLPEQLARPRIFKWVIGLTLLMSIPDFLGSVGYQGIKSFLLPWVPFMEQSMGWVLPALLGFGIGYLLERRSTVH